MICNGLDTDDQVLARTALRERTWAGRTPFRDEPAPSGGALGSNTCLRSARAVQRVSPLRDAIDAATFAHFDAYRPHRVPGDVGQQLQNRALAASVVATELIFIQLLSWIQNQKEIQPPTAPLPGKNQFSSTRPLPAAKT